MFEHLICAICPLEGEYEPGAPECGFLFPAFSERCADLDHVDIFQENPERPHGSWRICWEWNKESHSAIKAVLRMD